MLSRTSDIFSERSFSSNGLVKNMFARSPIFLGVLKTEVDDVSCVAKHDLKTGKSTSSPKNVLVLPKNVMCLQLKIHTPDPDSSKAAAAVYKKAKLRDLQVAEAGSTFPTHGDDEMKVI